MEYSIKKYSFILSILFSSLLYSQDVIFTAIVDGDLLGGTPKIIELYVSGEVNLNNYKIQKATNANDFESEMDLSGYYSDEFVYIVASDDSIYFFNTHYGSDENFSNIIDGGNFLNANGNDAFRILDKNSNEVIDQVGEEENFEDIYKNSYLYRINGTGPDGGWVSENWNFAGNNFLNDKTEQEHVELIPFGTYDISDSGSVNILEEEKNSFSIFPNPSSGDIIHLKGIENSIKEINIYDTIGKKIISKKTVENHLNISGLKSGIYILQIEHLGTLTSQKIIIE
ncbi:T9SS type A sorting domain-containing protein [Aureivirga sp. CE67]|uniref:T9SS type A sorting domain-containing protein n=1 Tax=Aureivirga sp. CE67 TaxID=1788983 RepID=UPI0018CA7665|nr:T9SS type A sorting domain-containing protein [Aureivirga sp. CE67]